ncbi:ketopantoate hydroxymethyltransferase [Paenibacillus sp. GCM10027626]|uniref:ketopantoate hydroxymethyltransferase n=1 Tax=Paenibacillus sp. GCM10027626 TaxID=3273411 RepID=UPI00363E05AD
MIATAYLGELASYTNNKIAKVVINGTFEITSFSVKQATGGVIEMKYMIPNGAVPEATLVELRSAGNDVISSNVVSVPITSDTIITQKIQVREAQA